MRIFFVHYKVKSFYNVSVCFLSTSKINKHEWSVDIKCLYELEIQTSPRAIDVLHNPNFAIWIPFTLKELEIKKLQKKKLPVSFLSTRLYDKRDDFNFAITNCSHLDSNVPTVNHFPYRLYISQPIQYSL